MRVLIAEDDPALQQGLQHVLAVAGHQTIVADDGLRADTLLVTEPFDLIVLDLGLPGLDGMVVLQRLRNRKQSTPVLILSARDSTVERVHGLDVGADDYMTKPFELSEFEARVRSLLRRGRGMGIQLGDLNWSSEERRARIDGTELMLTQYEANILEVLIQSPGRIISKDSLAYRIGSNISNVGNNMVEVYIYRLRRKLENANVEVKTVRGLGYLLAELHRDEIKTLYTP